MSGKRIVEVVELCEQHGRPDCRLYLCSHPGRPHDLGLGVCELCPGGSRRTLTEGQYVLIEKVDGEWPMWLADVLGDVVHAALGGLPHEPSRCAAIALGVLGALVASAEGVLSDHTEGTP